ncbi:ATP-binding cassette domain-containing protein [Devosia sp. ZB163]|uniref:ATP-binding cassette domain-containing protein n=1 Tax=Devosia sp. ZB163 TaxID=3025938 RepID=UPI00235FC278|nr:ATP-binding cassette domain-containing protein [Devosia sp. ZB163]MDC9823332.1 ATP-binding cassette domain-containing protein [Devosia sp. ZB163]
MTSPLPEAPQGPLPAIAISVEKLSAAYGGRTVLDEVTLQIPRGTSFALLGPNGAGKTTLLNILSTLRRPDGGSASVAGADVVRQQTLARRSLGVVFQDSSLDDRLSAWENLEFHGLVYGMAPKLRRERSAAVLALVELEDWRDDIVRSFSGGMRRRLEIARALLHEPQILFLDEPTVGLDAQTRLRIWRYLDEMRRERQLTVLTTTHYIEEVESADTVCIIDHGRIIAEGSPEVLKSRHGSRWLHVVPRDQAALDAIRAQRPDAQLLGQHGLALPADDGAMTDAFLTAFRDRLTEVRFQDPTLESVFLSLTGRQLRDRADGDRDAERAAGRRGGRR